jgi:hypothetical protein
MDPYIGMSDISTAAMMIKECQDPDHLSCAIAPQGALCSEFYPCHCIVTPIRVCVQNQ